MSAGLPLYLAILTAASCLIWLWLLLFRHRFWRAYQRLEPAAGDLDDWPDIAVVVPARDEADVIADTLSSLARQDYPGRMTVVLVDDHSTDGTAAAAETAGLADRLHVCAAPPLPSGWTGKLAAMAHGVSQADRICPDYRFVLFTDADIEHPADAVRRLVLKAEADKRDLVSLMVRLHCRSGWERLLIPAFVFFFQKLYPFAAVNNDRSKMAAAAGGVMLVRRTALERSGGIAAVHDNLIDDCALAASIKSNRGRLWLGLADETRSVRPYRGLGEIWRMVARTAYTQLDYSPVKLAGATLGMCVIYLAGPLVVLLSGVHGDALSACLGLSAWILMSCAFVPTLAYYRQSVFLAPLLPLIGALYTMMTIDSAWRHWRRRGGNWKGRTY